jgi:hypothetical protein
MDEFAHDGPLQASPIAYGWASPPSSSSLTSPARPVLLACFRWEEERNGRGKAATACMQAEESGRRREEEEEEGGRRRGR